MSQKQVAFKPCKNGDGFLFPPYLSDLISADHPVRLINALVDQLDITDIINTYKGGGSSSYHPRMLIKLLVYGYFDGVTSTRKLEQSTHENVCYMWLCGMNKPTYATISTFRSGRLKGKVKDLFASILKQIYGQGKLQVGTQFIDGTIFESVANKHTYVWRKNTERYKSNTEQKIKAILADVEEYLDDNGADEQPAEDESSTLRAKKKSTGSAKVQTNKEPQSLTSDEVKQKIKALKKKKDKSIDKKIKKLEKDLLQKLMKYEEQERLLKGRNSYSKTDPDASFMRMKEDRRGKPIPKPAYNVQLSTSNQFILNYSLHQNPNDATCFIDHMVESKQLFAEQNMPDIAECVGDAIYGTQENYEFLNKEEITSYLKYPLFDKELKSNNKGNKPFDARQLFYNEAQDFFVCPMGQRMHKVGQKTETRRNGYKATIDEYQNVRCENCPLQGVCHKGKGVRKIQFNKELERYRKEALDNLTSEKGEWLRSQRSVDVEPVFGHLKFNRKWDRFTLVGLDKVKIELGLHAIAHNLRKWVKKSLKKGLFTTFQPAKTYQTYHISIIQNQANKTISLPHASSKIAA